MDIFRILIMNLAFKDVFPWVESITTCSVVKKLCLLIRHQHLALGIIINVCQIFFIKCRKGFSFWLANSYVFLRLNSSPHSHFLI